MEIEWSVLISSTKDYVKNNIDEVMVEHYRVFEKQIKPLPPEPELSDFYHPSEKQKMVNYYLM